MIVAGRSAAHWQSASINNDNNDNYHLQSTATRRSLGWPVNKLFRVPSA